MKTREENPVLFLSDDRVSHCIFDGMIFLKEISVILLSVPPHGTHIMQSLEGAFLGPMNTALATEGNK